MAVIIPTREQFKAFRDLPRDEPVHMLNALKYKPKATYDAPPPGGVSADVSVKKPISVTRTPSSFSCIAARAGSYGKAIISSH